MSDGLVSSFAMEPWDLALGTLGGVASAQFGQAAREPSERVHPKRYVAEEEPRNLYLLMTHLHPSSSLVALPVL